MIFSSLARRARGITGFAGAIAVVLAATTPGNADIKLDARAGQPVLPAGQDQRVYLRVSLEGVPFEKSESRTPVNVALVVDRSGSMQGPKIEQARQAAIMALNRLGATDIVSVVAYNHMVDTLIAARRVGNGDGMRSRIRAMQANGKTALYAGVEEGLRQVSRYRTPDRVNRVILLSDGLANVGPSSPSQVAVLGQKAARDGVTVSTIGLGLGYNEDLMARLAGASDGNHAFVERADQLVEVFNREFGDVLSVVGQDVIIRIECRAGFKPVRVLGREARVSGQTIELRMNQVYGAQEKYVLVEVEVPSDLAAAGSSDIAQVDVEYLSMRTRQRNTMSETIGVRFSKSGKEAKASIDKDVMTAVTTQIATLTDEEAVKRRDQGDIEGAKKLLRDNAAYLKQKAKELEAPALSTLGEESLKSADQMAGSAWNKNRKAMKARQYKNKTQQSY